jgi:tetratricopeptide (TPR) repeat protein
MPHTRRNAATTASARRYPALALALCAIVAVFAVLYLRLFATFEPWPLTIFSPALAAEMPVPDLKAVAATAPPTNTAEEHLIKSQEQVLAAVESLSSKSKEELDFAVLTVGFVGSLVLAVFAFFGWQTAKDARALKADGEQLLDKWRVSKAEVDKTLEKLMAYDQFIEAKVVSAMQPKLAGIANYSYKVAEFAGSQWAAMSSEDRLRNCDEAAAAIEAAQLGDAAHAALSFVWARKGYELLERGDLISAAQTLERAVNANAHHKPDRPYNLACTYAQLATLPGAYDTYVEKAVAELKACLNMASHEAIGSTVSKLYFYNLIRTDKDLEPIRSHARFKELVANLPVGP